MIESACSNHSHVRREGDDNEEVSKLAPNGRTDRAEHRGGRTGRCRRKSDTSGYRLRRLSAGNRY